MNMAQITVLDLGISVRERPLVAPAVIGRVPQNLQRILSIKIIDQLATGIIGIDHCAVAGFYRQYDTGITGHINSWRNQRQNGIPCTMGDIPLFGTMRAEQDLLFLRCHDPHQR